MKLSLNTSYLTLCFFLVFSSSSYGQNNQEGRNDKDESENKTVYSVDFFSQYRPINALDMVERVPGFSIDGGDNVRGFGGSAGNVLIDGARPSTKSDRIQNILSRIGKDAVDRIELYRGSTGSLDVGTEQSVVVNVVRKTQIKGSGTWEVELKHESGNYIPTGQIAYSSKVNNTEYTASIERGGFDFTESGVEQLTSADPLMNETRREVEDRKRGSWESKMDTQTTFANDDVLNVNAKIKKGQFEQAETSRRTTAENIVSNVLLNSDDDDFEYEIGIDCEHLFANDLSWKSIFLVQRENKKGNRSFRVDRVNGPSTQSRSVRESKSGESIGRVEFDFTRLENHVFQFGGEIVHNFVENEFQLFSLDGGIETIVEILGANTKVTEKRQELFLTDNWNVNDQLDWSFGLSVERSRISQNGDSTNERSFTYFQPSVNLTYKQSPQGQWRIRVNREAGQLNFFDFISSNNFADGDVDFGNPELEPEQTLKFELGRTHNFGDIGVLEVVLFHDWISDVQDLLPIGGTSEVAGNIGKGRRWGGELNMTLPLTILGLENTRIDSKYRLQRSEVTDPVLFEKRELSGEKPEEFEFMLLHELPSIKSNLIVEYSNEGREKEFGLDEIETTNSSASLNFIWETTFSSGINMTLELKNLLDRDFNRDRVVFDGSRLDNNISFQETRQRNDEGRFIWLKFNGAF